MNGTPMIIGRLTRDTVPVMNTPRENIPGVLIYASGAARNARIIHKYPLTRNTNNPIELNFIIVIPQILLISIYK